MLLKTLGRRKLQLKQETSMVLSEVTKKTIRASMEVIDMELGTRKREKILEFCAAMNMPSTNTLFKMEGKSPSELSAWSMNNSG